MQIFSVSISTNGRLTKSEITALKFCLKIRTHNRNEYDWESLQDYLPPDRESMEDGIVTIRDTLDRCGSYRNNGG